MQHTAEARHICNFYAGGKATRGKPIAIDCLQCKEEGQVAEYGWGKNLTARGKDQQHQKLTVS